MKRVLLIISLFIILALSGCGRSLIFGRYEIDTSHSCAPYPLNVYADADYNREVGANDYLLFAIASLSAYEVGEIEPQAIYLKLFNVNNFDPGWKEVETGTSPTGLAYDVYWRDLPERLDVIVAIRGTENSARDWFSNAAWITQILPLPNEYDAIRARFQGIREKAFEAARGREVRFVATGHSLGGGLAQHLAAAYPCVSAAVFNSSPVVNRHHLWLGDHKNLVVQIYEVDDELRLLRRLTGAETETDIYRKYRQNVSVMTMFQHAMSRLAVGMSRLIADCQFEQRSGKRSCAIPAEDTRAANIYCKTYASRRLNSKNEDPPCDPIYNSPAPEFPDELLNSL